MKKVFRSWIEKKKEEAIMYEFNSNFSKFPGGYLFAVLHQKLDAYKKEHPKEKVISLGVGDVTLPLPKAVTDAMQKAMLE